MYRRSTPFRSPLTVSRIDKGLAQAPACWARALPTPALERHTKLPNIPALGPWRLAVVKPLEQINTQYVPLSVEARFSPVTSAVRTDWPPGYSDPHKPQRPPQSLIPGLATRVPSIDEGVISAMIQSYLSEYCLVVGMADGNEYGSDIHG